MKDKMKDKHKLQIILLAFIIVMASNDVSGWGWLILLMFLIN